MINDKKNEASAFQINGFEIINNFISHEDILQIKDEINSFTVADLKGGVRNAEKKIISINQFVNSIPLIEKAKDYLLGTPKIVRVILFDKTTENNWMVPWHQDRTIAVSKKFASSQWGPWSIKDGIHHVQPPLEVLHDMITFRIHMDESTIENGCLRLIPGSHHVGFLSPNEIETYFKNAPSVNCEASEGSLMVMRPLLIHSSYKAKNQNNRKVIHVEYSSYQLPKGINWI